MRAPSLMTAVALMLSLAGTALAAPTLDANGKCRDGGKFVKTELCKAAPTAAAGKCRDIKTKTFAKCGAPGTEPAPKT